MTKVEPELETVNALLDHIAVQQAAMAAAGGAYASADAFLTDLIARSPDRVDALDLRARAHAQQGNFEIARSCWQRVLALESANTAAIAGIARIDSMCRYPVWALWAVPILVAMLAVGAFAAISIGVVRNFDRNQDFIAGQIRLRSRTEDSANRRISGQLNTSISEIDAVRADQMRVDYTLRRIPKIESGLSEEKQSERRLERRLTKVTLDLVRLRKQYNKIGAKR